MPATSELKRTIGLRDLALFYVVTSLSGRWTATAAAAGPSILVIWLAALTCFFVPLAASVMELSSRYPQEGGMYVWSREAFGDFSGFITAWTYWTSNLPYFPGILYFGAASVLFAFGTRAQALASSPHYYVGFSVACLALITLVNILGVNLGKWLNNIGSLGSLISLAVVIALGAISYWRFGAVVHFTQASLRPHWSLKNAVFWSTVFLAFAGVEAGSSMGDEIRNPRRTIPLAILAGGIVVAVGYIAGTAALLVALPGQAVAGPDGFVDGVRALSVHLGVGWLLAPMALLVGVNAVGGPAAYLSSTSRLPFVAGIDHYLPAAFGRIHPRFKTPWVAIGIYGLAGAATAVLSQAGTSVRGAYDVLVGMTVLMTFLPYLFIFGAMIRVQSRPVEQGVRRVPGGRLMAIVLGLVGLASTAVTIVLSTIPSEDDPHPALAVVKTVGGSAVLVGAGVAVFAAARLARRKQEQSRQEPHSVSP
ncbi:MAG TPA: APC family permease [Terracidiphilus sp.]|nr:APC family permease [Terracidiphilus sp.]